MGEYIVSYSDDARTHLKAIKKSGNRAYMNKIQRIVIELSNHPETGTGHPEPLKHELSGLWSRRIDKKNRIVYGIDNENHIVHIISLLKHYGDR